MKKWLLSLCMVLALIGCKEEKKDIKQAENKPTVKIGIILPLTGPNSFMGEQMREGYEFVKDYLHSDVNYELVYFDDQQSSSKAAVGVKKLIEFDKVDALLTGTSQTASIAASAAEMAKVVHLGISSDNRFTDKDYNYTMAANPKDESAVLLKYMKDLGYQNVALITADEMFSNLVEENITKQAEDYGVKITFNEKFTPGATSDYRIMLRKAVESKPDIFLLQTFPPHIDILTKQLIEIFPDAKITSLYAFFISTHPELYKGRFCLNINSNDEAFKKAFYEKYGKGLEQMSAAAYAQLSLMLDILKHKGESLDKIVKEHKSIFGDLTLEGRSVRYLPIVETLGE